MVDYALNHTSFAALHSASCTYAEATELSSAMTSAAAARRPPGEFFKPLPNTWRKGLKKEDAVLDHSKREGPQRFECGP